MKNIAEKILRLLPQGEEKIRLAFRETAGGKFIYPASIHLTGPAAVMLGRDEEKRFLLVAAPSRAELPAALTGEVTPVTGGVMLQGELCAANAAALRVLFPWTAPVSLHDVRTTIGFGDRLGLATAGHLESVRKFAASPVLAQQSMRELTLTNRTFQNVVDDACFLVFAADYQLGYGADGDHLKKISDIDVALAAGMPMITLDLSDVMNAAAGEWSEAEVESAFAAMPANLQQLVLSAYAGKDFALGDCSVFIDEVTAKRCAVMYTKALDFAREVYGHLQEKRGDRFDLEISIDETTTPTLPSHHLFITKELHRRGVNFSSLAPRFIGEFQKAIDYIGDLVEFDRQFKVHARIACGNGNYKISIHSGSDKFAVYPTIGKETQHYLHLKTAGTSWLVAVTVIAKYEPALYRAMHQCALEHFQEMLKLYHITADIGKIPALETLSDDQLPDLMEMPEARQLLHINYGPILCGELRERFFAAMHRREAEYTEAIKLHFDKHLALLGLPPR